MQGSTIVVETTADELAKMDLLHYDNDELARLAFTIWMDTCPKFPFDNHEKMVKGLGWCHYAMQAFKLNPDTGNNKRWMFMFVRSIQSTFVLLYEEGEPNVRCTLCTEEPESGIPIGMDECFERLVHARIYDDGEHMNAEIVIEAKDRCTYALLWKKTHANVSWYLTNGDPQKYGVWSRFVTPSQLKDAMTCVVKKWRDQ